MVAYAGILVGGGTLYSSLAGGCRAASAAVCVSPTVLLRVNFRRTPPFKSVPVGLRGSSVGSVGVGSGTTYMATRRVLSLGVVLISRVVLGRDIT